MDDPPETLPTPNPQSPAPADLWRMVEAYARETGEIDLDLFIAALAASEGIPVEEAGLPPEWAGPPGPGPQEGEAL